jgi:hypothetical protein
LAAFLALPATVLAADPIGAESCKSCHRAAYEAWKESQHASSLESLSARQKKDGRCLSCHAPQNARGLAEVSCESCHGGGQYYSPSYVMKDAELARAVGLEDPSEKMCRRCHDENAPSLKAFNFVEKLKLIDHWTAERAARGEATKATTTSGGKAGR